MNETANTPGSLVRVVQVVTFLLAAFGGYLTQAAPPAGSGPKFALGGASILAVCVLLYISALARTTSQRRYRQRWLAAALGLVIVATALIILYPSMYELRTFPYPGTASSTMYFRGTELTDSARSYFDRNPGMSVQQLVGDYGGVERLTRVWPAESIAASRRILSFSYIALVVTVASAIFCLTEALLAPARSRSPRRSVSAGVPGEAPT